MLTRIKNKLVCLTLHSFLALSSLAHAADAATSLHDFQLQTSPFPEQCGEVPLIKESDYTEELKRDLLECEISVQVVEDSKFFETIIRKLGNGAADTAEQSAEFLKSVGQKAAKNIEFNNQITEALIHCARNDKDWFDKNKGVSEIYNFEKCPVLLADVRSVVRENTPKLRIEHEAMKLESGKGQKLKDLLRQTPGLGLELPSEKVAPSKEEKAAAAAIVAKERKAASEAAAAAVKKNSEKLKELTARFSKGGYYTTYTKEENQERWATIQSEVDHWYLKAVDSLYAGTLGTLQTPFSSTTWKFWKSKEQKAQEWGTRFLMKEKFTEHAKEYGRLMQTAPVMGYLTTGNPSDEELALAAEKLLENGKADAAKVADLISDKETTTAAVRGGRIRSTPETAQEATNRRIELMKYTPIVRETLAANRQYCGTAASIINYVKGWDGVKNKAMVASVAASILLPLGAPFVASALPAVPLLAGSTAVAQGIGYASTAAFYYGAYGSYVNTLAAERRAFDLVHTVENKEGRGIASAEVSEYLSQRDHTATSLAWVAGTLAVQGAIKGAVLGKNWWTAYISRARLEETLTKQGMAKAEIGRILDELSSGDRDRTQKAALHLMKKLGLNEDEVQREIRMMQALAAKNLITDQDVAALRQIHARLAKIPLKDRPAVYGSALAVINELDPKLIHNGNRVAAFEAAMAGSEFGVKDPKKLATVIGGWGDAEGLSDLAKTYALAKQKLALPELAGIASVDERKNRAFILAVHELGFDEREVKFLRASAEGWLDFAKANPLSDPIFREVAKLNREDRRTVYLAAYKALHDLNPAFTVTENNLRRLSLETIVSGTQMGIKDPNALARIIVEYPNQSLLAKVFQEAKKNLSDPALLKLRSKSTQQRAAIDRAVENIFKESADPRHSSYAFRGMIDSNPTLRQRHIDAIYECAFGSATNSKGLQNACHQALMAAKSLDVQDRHGLIEFAVSKSRNFREQQKRLKAISGKIEVSSESDLNSLRFINPVDYQTSNIRTRAAELYGARDFAAWKDADEFLSTIPQGKFEPSIEMFTRVHEKSSAGLNPFLKSLDDYIPDGLVPDKGGVLKARDSVGKWPLTHPLTEKQYEAIKANPYLAGFIELPNPLSKVGARRGWIHYAKAKDTEAKLKELIDWYSKNKDTMDPVELAAKFQYNFVSIHPFVDGNGRTSRLLMDRILREHGLPPSIIKDTTDDILLSQEEWVAQVRQGVDRYLTIAEKNNGATYFVKGQLPANIFQNSTLGALAISHSNDAKLLKEIQDILPFSTFSADGKKFQFSGKDGLLYDSKGVPYVLHQNRLYPVPDRTYRMLEMNVKRSIEDTYKGKKIVTSLNPVHEQYVRDNLELLNKVKEGKLDLSTIKVEPYSTIEKANRDGDIFLYDWQRNLFEHAAKIDTDDPEQILMPFRVTKTIFDRKWGLKATGSNQPQAAHDVLAQYEMADRIYYDLAQEAKKHFPDLLTTVERSREKLHHAGRELLDPALKARSALPADQQSLVQTSSSVKLFDAYLPHSKLAYPDFKTAAEKIDDSYVTLLRSDSTAVNYIGFLSHTDFVKVFNKLPMHGKIQELLNKLSDFLFSSAGDAKVRELLKTIAEKAKNGENIFAYLPASIRKLAQELEPYYANVRQALYFATNKLLASKFANRPIGIEFERSFVSDLLHAGGGGLKDSKSFTSSSKLLENFQFASSTLAQGETAVVGQQVSIVRIPKSTVNVNYGTNMFPDEYEFLARKAIGPSSITSKFGPDDLKPIENMEALSPESKKLLGDYF